MYDRVSKYPGRVRMIPVPGQDGVFDLVRADEPVQAGTALNKANLLSEAVATSLGLPKSGTPSDALAVLRGRISSLIEMVSYVGTGTSGLDHPCKITFSAAPDVVFFVFKKNQDDIIETPPADEGFGLAAHAVIMSELTTEYTAEKGFSYSESIRNGPLHPSKGRKSSDGRSVEWYNGGSTPPEPERDSREQLNTAGEKYFFIGIKFGGG